MSNIADDLIKHLDKTTKDLLQATASENGFVCYEIEDDEQSIKWKGFYGTVSGVILTCNDKKDKKEILNVVIKSASKSDDLRTQIILNEMYTRESYIYDVVFRAFEQFEVNKKFKPTSFAPKFYKSNLEYKNEIIVLENLASSNYKMYPATKAMDAKHDLTDPNKPTSVRLIDFQRTGFGLPVMDVAIFLYTCSEKKVIEELEDYLRLYYNSLAAHLVKLGSNPDKVYPYSIFFETVER
ncbi:hypothetical protein ILUMI_01590 [Ignelater luminosus]|uniref:CHK kinase-like domain-containing protein n=1 Tax=Ignelater luminosus TaxID=2038154 RepID=A0A8K0DJD8_IGNLU|nr:hypothetical protein ILUMI_01590 [Ignelater luminosus]